MLNSIYRTFFLISENQDSDLRDTMCENINSKISGCLIRTHLWSAEVDHKNKGIIEE